jgi:acetolactate synthase-1/2/3 large subunit
MGLIHGGKAVAQALKEEGVTHLFTLCGGHIQNIYDGCIDEGIRVIDVRHEQTAAHAADGYSRVSRKIGVCAVTAGPGVTDAVTGVATAYRAQSPMVIIGGAGPRMFKYMGSLQDMDHVELLKPITKWSATVTEPRRIREFLQTAFRIAKTGVPGPVFLEFPLDLLFDYIEEDQVEHYPRYRTEASCAPDPRYVEKALELLEKAERPVLIVGTQWWWSPDHASLGEFLSRFPMPTYLNGMARGALPPDHPSLFVLSRGYAISRADLVLIFGTPLDFRLNYGRPPRFPEHLKLIQVDLDPQELGRNRGPDVGIYGDTGLTLRAFLNGLSLQKKRKVDSPWLEEIRAKEKEEWEKIVPELHSDAVPINPLRACKEIVDMMEPSTVIVGDGGDFLGTFAKIARPATPGSWMDPGPLGTLGVGPGYAMAAKLLRKSDPVWIIYGDGSFGLHAMEFEAMVRQNIPVIGIIGNDAAWTQIRRGQIQFFGEERAVATKLSYTRYDLVVSALGGHGEYVEKPQDIRPALERAMASGKPAVVNIKIGSSEFRKDAISV